MMNRELPLWRSILFVPVLNDKFVQGAPKRGADCIQRVRKLVRLPIHWLRTVAM